MTIRILAISPYFVPGFKAGGPIRSVLHLTQHLGSAFHFEVLTRDRDLGDPAPYPGIAADRWTEGTIRTYYASPRGLRLRPMASCLREAGFDVLYLNSFFDPRMTIGPLLLRASGRIAAAKVVLATRGELNPGALALKAWKKRPFVFLARQLGLYDDIVWQASTEIEARTIREIVGPGPKILIAPDLPAPVADEPIGRPSKVAGSLRIVFLGRISPMKNLEVALEILQNAENEVSFDVFGPIEDRNYWVRCLDRMQEMPDHVRVSYCGEIPPTEVAELLGSYDLLFLPTRGENYGHVIVEALAAGCPVLISDRTPWNDLEEHGAGWSLPLEDTERFHAVLAHCAGLDEEEHSRCRLRARTYARRCLDTDTAVRQNQLLFETAAGAGPGRRGTLR